MTDPAPAQTPPSTRYPFFTAPALVTVAAAILVLLHVAVQFASPMMQNAIAYDYALAPQRFWAPAGSQDVYPNAFAGLLTLLSSAFLHADWMHVLVNSFMLLAVGAPVSRALGLDLKGALAWLLIFVGSAIGGSALYLALSSIDSPYLIGASGGVSGFIGAAFLLNPRGGKHGLLSRPFLGMTVAFVLANALLVVTGPFLLGAMVSWEAHAGGYIVGALLMAVLPARSYARPEVEAES